MKRRALYASASVLALATRVATANGSDWPGIQIVCVGNILTETGEHDAALTEVAAAASRVCDRLRQVPGMDVIDALPRTPSKRDLFTTLGKLDPARPRVLVYAGHGTFDEKKGLEFPLRKGRGSEPVTFVELANALVRAAAPRADRAGAWSVMALNTCDSGFADVRTLSAPISVIGSGYGAVAARLDGEGPWTTAPMSEGIFGRALGDALAGRADERPGGNGDGIITDREAVVYINAQIRSARIEWYEKRQPALLALRRRRKRLTWQQQDAIDFWVRAPTAALRSQADVALPVAVGRTGRLSASSPSHVPRSWLIVDDHAAPRGVRQHLARWEHLHGFRVVSSRPADATTVGNLLTLVILPAAAHDGPFLELRDAHSRSLLWARAFSADTHDAALALAVAQALPARFSALGWGAELSARKPLWIRVNGPFPKKPVEIRSWQGETLGRRRSMAVLELGKAPVAPCPGGTGQCVLALRPPQLAGEARDWLLLEQP